MKGRWRSGQKRKVHLLTDAHFSVNLLHRRLDCLRRAVRQGAAGTLEGSGKAHNSCYGE